MTINYITTCERLRPEQLQGFFVGWPKPPSPTMHLRMLEGSSKVVLAIDQHSGVVVGFINAISDGSHFAFIPLLEVLPTHRGCGIGSELIRRMIEELGEYYAIDLCCDESLSEFYNRLGFTRTVGMCVRNYARQSTGAL